MLTGSETAQDATLKSRSSSALKVENLEGLVDYVHYDENEKTFTHELVQDVEPFLNHVKALKLEQGAQAGKAKSGDMYHAGSFPPVIVHGWLNVRGLTMKDFKGDVLKDFLNDPDVAAFRIWPGRV